MVSTVHGLKNVLRNVQIVTVGVLDCDAVPIDRLDVEVGSLREVLLRLELLRVPQRLARALYFLGRAFLRALFRATDCSAQDIGSCAYEGLGDLSLRLGCASMGEISDVHRLARGVVALLHDLNHLIAALVNLYESEDNAAGCKLSHLILDLEAIWRAFRMIIAKFTNVLTMAWSISNMECRFDATSVPAELERLVKATLDILGEVTASTGRLTVDLSLYSFNVSGEVCDIETIVVLHISVSHKADSHCKTLTGKLHVVNDLTQGCFRALDPGMHRASAIKNEAQI